MYLLALPGLLKKSPWFRWYLAKQCEERGLDANSLLVTMHLESAGINPKAEHPSSKAYGLIQVLPRFAKPLTGFCIEQIHGMNAEEQLKYVVFKRKWPTESDPGTFYMANFLPWYTNAPDDEIIGAKNIAPNSAPQQLELANTAIYGGTKRGAIYHGNYGFDTNLDGIITVGEVKNHIRALHKKLADKYGYVEVDTNAPEPGQIRPGAWHPKDECGGDGGFFVLLGIALLVGGMYIAKR